MLHTGMNQMDLQQEMKVKFQIFSRVLLGSSCCCFHSIQLLLIDQYVVITRTSISFS